MKYFLICILLFCFFGCSANDVVKNNREAEQSKTLKKSNEILATHHLVNGSVAELNGDFRNAVIEFEKALEADPQPSIYFIIGKNYLKLNKLSTALRYARSAVQLSPDNIEYKFLLGHIYQTARIADSAAYIYNDIIKLDSANIQAYFALGNLIENDRPTDALLLYNKILDLTGPEWQVLVKIADINERIGNVEGMINSFKNLLELNPSSLELQKILVQSYIRAKRLDEAQKLVDDALLLFPDDLGFIEYRANILITQEKWDEGVKEYIKIIRSNDVPHDVKLSIGLGFLNEASKDSALIPLAKEIFTEVSKDTTNWQTNVYLAEIAVLENQDSLAIEYFNNAAHQAEWNARIWIRYGGLLFDNRKYDEAIEKLQPALKNFPDEFVLNLILGLSYSQKNDHINAKKYFLKCYELNPNDLTALSSLGFTLNQLNEPDEALVYLNKAMSIDSKNIQVLGLLGLIYDNKKMYEECDIVYNQALEADSSNAFILNNYAYSLAERGERLDDALSLSKSAVDQEPENSSYLDTIGWIYFRLGNYDLAKEFIQKAIDIDSNNAVQTDHLGDVYFKLGDHEKAKELWNKAFEMDNTIENLKEKIERGTL